MQQRIPTKLVERVAKLESDVLRAAEHGRLEQAKVAINELRPILEQYGQRSRLLESYLFLYEGALENGDLDTAKRGFQFVRDYANQRTRRYLEATALLAITYVRDNDLFSAEPLMHEVLTNDGFIKSEQRREIFVADLVDRFDREGALSALSRVHTEELPIRDVHERAMSLLQEGLSEDEIEERLGQSVPQEVRDFILKVNRVSRKALPTSDQRLLPAPKELIKDKTVGGLVFRAFQKKLYPYICNENSEVYQAWVQKGLSAICDQAFVANVVVGALGSYKVLAGGIAVGLTAMIIKSGLTKFCLASKPEPFFSKRRK